MQSLWTLFESHQHSRNPSQVSAPCQCQEDATEQFCIKLVNFCSVRTTKMPGMNSKNFDEVFGTLIAQGISPDDLFESVCKQVCHMPHLPSMCVTMLVHSAVQSGSVGEHAGDLHPTVLAHSLMPIILVHFLACSRVLLCPALMRSGHDRPLAISHSDILVLYFC